MSQELRSPSSVLAYCRELDVKIICLRFTDFLGRWRSVRIPFSDLREESFEYGFGLSPAEIPAWSELDNGDILLAPQTDSCFFDPFCPVPTLNLFCGLQDPITRQDLAVDGRATTIKATAYMASCGFAERAVVGADIEFNLLPATPLFPPFPISRENPAAEDDIESVTTNKHDRLKEMLVYEADAFHGSHDATAQEELTGNLVAEVIRQLGLCRVQVDSQKLRCPQGNWASLAIRADDPVRAADSIITAKYIIQSVARRFGRSASFLPQAQPELRYCGLPLNIGFQRYGDSLLGGTDYGGLNSLGLGAIGGLLRHLPSLCGLVAASPDSYLRLAGRQGEQPAMISSYSRYGQRTVVRVPSFSASPKSKRIEFAACDSSANPYVAISATIMAMIDGAQNKLSPGDPLERLQGNAEYSASSQHMEASNQGAFNNELPNSLDESLAALEQDHDYLTRGGVFLSEFFEAWLACKRQQNGYKQKI